MDRSSGRWGTRLSSVRTAKRARRVQQRDGVNDVCINVYIRQYRCYMDSYIYIYILHTHAYTLVRGRGSSSSLVGRISCSSSCDCSRCIRHGKPLPSLPTCRKAFANDRTKNNRQLKNFHEGHLHLCSPPNRPSRRTQRKQSRRCVNVCVVQMEADNASGGSSKLSNSVLRIAERTRSECSCDHAGSNWTLSGPFQWKRARIGETYRLKGGPIAGSSEHTDGAGGNDRIC